MAEIHESRAKFEGGGAASAQSGQWEEGVTPERGGGGAPDTQSSRGRRADPAVEAGKPETAKLAAVGADIGAG